MIIMKILVPVYNLYIAPPMGFGIIIKLLLNRGHQIKIIDLNNYKKSLKYALDFSPDIILLSLYTGIHKIFIQFVLEYKKIKKSFVIAGGPHCTFFSELIEQYDSIDAICLGEGETAITNFFNEYEIHKEIPENIENFYIRKNGKIIKNKFAKLENNLDKFPFCERKLFYELYPHMKIYPVELFIASRGCPFQCSYCFNYANDKIYGSSWSAIRYRTPENIIKEIIEVLNYKSIKFIEFHDDVFGLNKDWLYEFTKEYKNKINIPFSCHLIPTLVNEDSIKHIVNANLKVVTLGVQTFNDEYRARILNRPIKNVQIINAVKILKKYNIKIITQIMLGLPNTKFEDDLKTLEFNRLLRPDYAFASIFQPYPGTLLSEYTKSINQWDGDIEDIPSNFFYESILNFPKEHKRKIFILQSFYSVAVKFYYFKFILNIILKLPTFRFYKGIYFIFKTVIYQFFLYKINTRFYKYFPLYFKINFKRILNKL